MSDIDTLYARWLDGELSAEEIKSLKDSGEWAELEALVIATNSLKLPAYDKDVAFNKLMTTNKAKTANIDPNAHRIKLSTILSAAASLLLLLGALFFLRQEAPDATAEYGETINYVFSDNSKVLLNDGSSISYNQDKWADERLIKLTGEALFDVEKGSKFIVETENGSIEVLGTSFNVRAWGSNLYVECYHGKVGVYANGESTELTKLRAVNIVNGVFSSVEDINNEKPQWTTGTSGFKEESLNSVFAELERQYDIKVDRPNLNIEFTGIFSHDDIKKALQQISKPMGLKYDINEDLNHVIITN